MCELHELSWAFSYIPSPFDGQCLYPSELRYHEQLLAAHVHSTCSIAYPDRTRPSLRFPSQARGRGQIVGENPCSNSLPMTGATDLREGVRAWHVQMQELSSIAQTPFDRATLVVRDRI